VFRLNIGVTGDTFDQALGDAALEGAQVDFAASIRCCPTRSAEAALAQRAQPQDDVR
jgi:hypothetical protein